jgi:branched-chain amino acid transport system substrate-binding protein
MRQSLIEALSLRIACRSEGIRAAAATAESEAINQQRGSDMTLARRAILGVCQAALIGFSATAFAQTAPQAVNIGLVTSSTGQGAGMGIPERNGALLAEKVINAKGGIDGRPVKVFIEDDGSNAETALSKANDLLHNKKVAALIGTTFTAATVAVGGLTDPLKTPQIAFSGLGPAVELNRKCSFHLNPPQVLNARASLEIAKSLGAKKIGVLYDSGFGTVVMSFLKKLTDEYGVKIVAEEKMEIGATDATAQAAKIKAAQPDIVFSIATSATPIRAIRQLQMKQTIVALGVASYEYVNAMGSAADNIISAEFLVGEDPLPQQKEFVELYQREYSVLPKGFEASGWDAVYMLASAIAKAGPNATPEALCNALRTKYTGVMTSWDFSAPDMTGIALSGYVYSKLVGGKYTRLPFKAGQ